MASPQQVTMSMDASAPYLACLAQQSKVEVKEKANLLEAFTAMMGQEIEMANKYRILADGGEELFFAAEITNCCARQLKQCFPDCAPWKVDVLYTQGGANEQAFQMQRDWTCTCLCFNRPVVNIIDMKTGAKLGAIKDPCACCGLTFSLLDPQDATVLQAEGGCCQWGLCCPLPCGPCSEVNFPIKDAVSGENVGHIQKKVPSCCKFCCSPDVDNYKIDFGGVQHPQYKAMLIALSIFIDFRYFNDNSNDAGASLGGD